MKTFKWHWAMLSAWCLAAGTACAAYPEQPIRLIVPYAAGGGTDTAARMLAKKLSPRLGQPVLVENKPGAATQIGTSQVVRAAPDGYTLLMGTANLATNAVLYDKLPYDVARDLTPVAWATDVPVYLLVPAGSDIQDLDSLRRAAQRPDGLSFATAGVGSVPHLTGELFAHGAELALRHIPYKGSAEAVTALAGKQVPLSFDNLPPVRAQIDAGRVVPLAIAAQQRNPLLPDVPTMAEFGYPLAASSWWGVMAPVGTPADVVGKLNREIDAVLNDPEVRDYFVQQGMRPMGGPPEAFGRHIAEETRKWGKAVKQANVKIQD
ncbi:Bug family tripartite tricarboxylate transporter substrate binding protein [Bordetella petrii]|uniref:Bug family tripartite tricarboxylate transporter substrate binding protein n=1 Tax=Bordetella petrii TaxID=94624 RepID=UPI001E5FCAF8|nr:tripartite tricarboxylate transporter substrate binding protein [Bordetella petrii]MCD0505079.1 tripartite tricarboxylate transporter substrate binding protein [Bordetella petrii]